MEQARQEVQGVRYESLQQQTAAVYGGEDVTAAFEWVKSQGDQARAYYSSKPNPYAAAVEDFRAARVRSEVDIRGSAIDDARRQ